MYFIDLISKKVKKETEEEMRSIISITYEQQSSYYAVFPFDLYMIWTEKWPKFLTTFWKMPLKMCKCNVSELS